MGNVTKLQHYAVRTAGWPDPGAQNLTLTLALRLVRMYGDRLPSADRLMADFEDSRATAYRWRAALIEAAQQRTAA